MVALLYKFLFAVIDLISRLPFWVLHRISDVFFLLVYYVIGYRKKMVLRNIKKSFPAMSDKEARQVRKTFYRHFADLLVESVKSSTMSQEEFQRRYRFTNKDLLNSYAGKGRNALILSPHTGNWEWIFSLVPQVDYEVYGVYQKLNNPYFDQYIRDTRQRFHGTVVPTKEVFSTVQESIDSNEKFVIWMAADQACKPDKALWFDFLNQPTTFHQGFEALAREHNLVVFFMDIKKTGRSQFELELKLITEHPENEPEGVIVKQFAKHTEARIRKDPAYWLWSHNRWKHKRPS